MSLHCRDWGGARNPNAAGKTLHVTAWVGEKEEVKRGSPKHRNEGTGIPFLLWKFLSLGVAQNGARHSGTDPFSTNTVHWTSLKHCKSVNFRTPTVCSNESHQSNDEWIVAHGEVVDRRMKPTVVGNRLSQCRTLKTCSLLRLFASWCCVL